MLRYLLAFAMQAPSAAFAEEHIPSQYLNYSGPLDARPMDISKMKLECTRLAKRNGVDPRTILGKYQWGCTIEDQAGVCHVRYHDKPFRDDATGDFITVWSTLRHELAHCAGWGADHPQE